MLAYHNDPRVKEHYLARMRAHRAANELVQGYAYWRNGKGCAVGCTIHGSDHYAYERELGIPAEIAHLEDAIFEGLCTQDAREWPHRFLAAISPGADLSRVCDAWGAWNLIDPVHGVIALVSDQWPHIARIVRETGEACLRGERLSEAEAAASARVAAAAEVAQVAWDARAAGAAWAAWDARAARAAWAAHAAGAAWAARVARAAQAAWDARAAGTAEAAVAAADAEAAYWTHAADALIELLSTAPAGAS